MTLTARRGIRGLLTALLLILVIQFLVYRAGFIDVSGDGFFRALMTSEWSSSPFLVSHEFGGFSQFWFPPYFWLTGTVYWLNNDVVLATKLTSFVASLLALVALYQLTLRLMHARAAIATVLLVGLVPYYTWLSLSIVETSLYVLSVVLAFLCFVYWIQQRNISCLAGTSIFLLASSMFRPEGWILAGIFAFYTGILFFRKETENRFQVALSGLISIAFMLFWLADNWLSFGNPLYFILAQKEHIGAGGSYKAAAEWSRLLQLPFFMFVLSPLLFLSALIAIVAKRHAFNREILIYLAVIILHIGILALLFLYGLGTTAAPQRYGMADLVLLAPFAGWLVSDGLRGSSGARLTTLAFCLVYVSFSMYKTFQFPQLYRDVVSASAYLRSQAQDTPAGDRFARIATELDIRHLTGTRPKSDRDFRILVSEHAGMMAYSGLPAEFFSNPIDLGTIDERLYRSYFEQSEPFRGLEASFAENNIGTVLVRDRSIMEILPTDYRLEKTFGRYALFSRAGSTAKGRPAGAVSAGAEKPVAPGVWLARHRYDGDIFPVSLVLAWRVDSSIGKDCSYRLWLKAVNQHDTSKTFTWNQRPIFCWYDPGGRGSGTIIEDYIALDLPAEFPAGAYKISLSVTSEAGGVQSAEDTLPENARWTEFPQIHLAYSKRQVLVDHLSGRDRDWLFLLRVLAAL